MNDRTAAAVLAQAMSFQPAKLVLTGLEMGLFALLEDQPAAEPEIRTRLGLHTRGAGHFLAALVELKVLERDGELYRNTAETSACLVRGGSAYLGDFLSMVDRVMYDAWGKLAEGLRTGEPQAAISSGQDMFGEIYADDDKRRDFVQMTEGASRPLIPVLVESFDWGAHRSVLDLGGHRGELLAALVREHPKLQATVLDLPMMETDFHENIAALGLTGQVGFHGADFFTDPLPTADVVVIGHCMVDWTDEQRITLISNAFSAVRPGGAFLIYDPMLVENEEGYLRNLILSLNLQLMTPHGAGYRLDTCITWLQEAGFAEVTHRALGPRDVTLVTARKAPVR